MKDMSLYVGVGAGVLTAMSMVPQLLRLIKKKDAKGISIFMLIILILGVGGWVWYGCLKEDYPIIITNMFSVLINISILILALFYKSKSAA